MGQVLRTPQVCVLGGSNLLRSVDPIELLRIAPHLRGYLAQPLIDISMLDSDTKGSDNAQ